MLAAAGSQIGTFPFYAALRLHVAPTVRSVYSMLGMQPGGRELSTQDTEMHGVKVESDASECGVRIYECVVV